MRRRTFAKTAGAALAAAAFPTLFTADRALAWEREASGGGQPFEYAWLKGQARALAARPFQPYKGKLPDALARMSWDHQQAIRFRSDHALWRNDKLRFRAQFFHLGKFNTRSVQVFEVASGKSRPINFDPALFKYDGSGLDVKKLDKGLGFAGVQLFFHTDWLRDMVAFLGASYFRAVGASMQYGISARGLAVDCGFPRPEEFPVFTAFWLEQPAPNASTLNLYALLESESITGAYRFGITPAANLVMDVDAALYPRKAIERLGIAPLTSMFQCGENDRRMATDYRPEIHDSDGLAMCTGKGEWIWRPITNPPQLRFNAFLDNNPRGFGLLQRDREFENYQDDGVFYERRPGVWVEPRSDWGEGSVQLLELPTEDETFDNIVAFWNPKQPCKAGEERLFSYRLHWGSEPPAQSPLARVVATRTGVGGVVGQPRKRFSRRFAIDFAGGELGMLGKDTQVQPVISVTRGDVLLPSARPLHSVGGYRAIFDLAPADGSVEPINLRLYLAARGQTLSETWQYQYTPPAQADRKF